MIAKANEQPNSPWLNASYTLMDDFKYELTIAGDADRSIRRTALPIFVWILKHQQEALLRSALVQFAPLLPQYGWDSQPIRWTSPLRIGAASRVGIVLEIVDGTVRAAGTNSMQAGSTSTPSTVSSFFDRFDFLTNDHERSELVHEVIFSAATPADHERIARMDRDGWRYQTTPICLLVIDGDKRMLYCTTAVVDEVCSAIPAIGSVSEVTLTKVSPS